MKKTISGFTIVELLIVIVVIAILATISIVAYSGIQLRARDADRTSDVSNLKKKIETYYATNNSFPSAYDMANASFRKNSLDIQNDSMVMTLSSSQTITYCWPGNTTHYCYSGRNLDGSDCYAVSAICLGGYWIIYRTESNPGADVLYIR